MTKELKCPKCESINIHQEENEYSILFKRYYVCDDCKTKFTEDYILEER